MAKQQLSVRELANGRWVVMDGDVVVADCDSNTEAWREWERLDRRPTWQTAKRAFWGRKGKLPG